MKFRNKKILVVGFGASGQAAVRFFLEEGAKIAVTDQRKEDELPVGAWRAMPLPIEFHFGEHPPEIFERRDLIVVSPGVPLDLPGLLLARRRRIPILGEFGLASELLKLPLKLPMIAVTGTNGKSTTATLIARLLEEGGKKAALAGNIGRPLLEVVMGSRRGDPRDRPDWVVAEVSSYQLETVRKFHPKVSVLLNITEDHLDRYASFQDYARAKFRIFKEQGPRDLLIYKEDDPTIRKGIRRARAKKIGFSVGANLVRNRIVCGEEEYRLDRVRLVGLHNVENMMASIVAARCVGITPLSVQRTLESFEGLPHRTEFVREREGVRYYDDSKGTNVDAAVKSLAGFPDKQVILIAGGRDKGGSYAPLRAMAEKKVKLMILIGEARDRIAAALSGIASEPSGLARGERGGLGAIGGAAKKYEDASSILQHRTGPPIIKVERLEEAVPLAARRAEQGDIVLLSPACSSFDQFKDYKERGDLFKKLVMGL